MAIVKDHENGSLTIDTEKCEYCRGDSAVRKADKTLMTSQELCAQMGTCSATIAWDKLAEKTMQ